MEIISFVKEINSLLKTLSNGTVKVPALVPNQQVGTISIRFEKTQGESLEDFIKMMKRGKFHRGNTVETRGSVQEQISWYLSEMRVSGFSKPLEIEVLDPKDNGAYGSIVFKMNILDRRALLKCFA